MFNKSKEKHVIDYLIKPGHIFVSEKPAMISAVLGSCVSVCIYDNRLKIGGMNNFRLPVAEHSSRSTACYGNIATSALINMMIDTGSKVKYLEAQIFGGSSQPDSPAPKKDIAQDNIKIARNILKKKGIPIVSQDIGGEKGRKIVFDTISNQILVLKVDKIRKSDWYPYEDQR